MPDTPCPRCNGDGYLWIVCAAAELRCVTSPWTGQLLCRERCPDCQGTGRRILSTSVHQADEE